MFCVVGRQDFVLRMHKKKAKGGADVEERYSVACFTTDTGKWLINNN